MYQSARGLFAASLFALLLAAFGLPACASSIPETRAVWLNADSLPTTRADAAALMEKYAKNNINLVFPEVICRGYAVYESRFIDRDPRFLFKNDPLALLIPEAHKRGIEVHPWVWVFRAGYTQHKGSILRKHPEWIETNRYGEQLSANGGYWISPAVPEARKFLLNVYSELVRKYQVDGLHLDYIRYESQTPVPYGYNPFVQTSFSQIYNIDPVSINRLTPGWDDWQMHREEFINTFVHSVSLQMRYLKPDIVISAAVVPDISEARSSFLQNWRHWVNNRWIDFIVPMTYSTDTERFRTLAKLVYNTVENKLPIAAGLGAHLLKPNPNMLVEQTLISREEGCLGQSIFAGSYLSDDMLASLAAGPYSQPTCLPFRNQTDIALTLAKYAMETSDPVLLKLSQNYSAYLEYQSKDVPFIAPMKPIKTVPENILPVPTTHAIRSQQPVNVDGKLDEECWQKANRETIDHTADGEYFDSSTEFMTCYDDTALYVAFSVHSDDSLKLTSTVTKRDGPVFYDDSVEVFVDPTGTHRHYYQISVNSLGTQFDQSVNNSMNVSWNGNWTSATSVSDNTWITEIAIPFATLNAQAPLPASRWYINFTRNTFQQAKPVHLNWSVVYGSFHSPDRFGTIVFD